MPNLVSPVFKNDYSNDTLKNRYLYAISAFPSNDEATTAIELYLEENGQGYFSPDKRKKRLLFPGTYYFYISNIRLSNDGIALNAPIKKTLCEGPFEISKKEKQTVKLTLVLEPCFMEKGAVGVKCDGISIYFLEKKQFSSDSTNNMRRYYAKEGKLYSDAQCKQPFRMPQQKYYFLATADDVAPEEKIQKSDCSDPVELADVSEQQIELSIKSSPLFVDKTDNAVMHTALTLYCVANFNTTTDLPMDCTEYLLNNGKLFYPKHTEERAFLNLNKYYFITSRTPAKDPKEYVYKKYCSDEITLEKKASQHIELSPAAGLRLHLSEPLKPKHIPFPGGVQIAIGLIDATNSRSEKSYTTPDSKQALTFPFKGNDNGYDIKCTFTQKTYFNLDDNMLEEQLDTVDLSKKSLFLLPDTISLKDSVWDVKKADYNAAGDYITRFDPPYNASKPALEPEWLHIQLLHYDYVKHTFKSVERFLMLEGYVKNVIKTQSNVYDSNCIWLPWIESGKGKSFRDTSNDIKLKYSYDIKCKWGKLPKQWENQWETHKYWRAMFNKKPDFLLAHLAQITSKDKPIKITLLPDNPIFEPDQWNNGGAVQGSTNCYAYAMNSRLGHTIGVTPQPGRKSATPAGPVTCSEVKRRVLADSTSLSNNILEAKGDTPPEKEGYYLVALVTTKVPTDKIDNKKKQYYMADYHWYRRDRDGFWSHKPGTTPVIWHDAKNKRIQDPKKCNRRTVYPGGVTIGGNLYDLIIDYTNFCGYFYVKKGGAQVT